MWPLPSLTDSSAPSAYPPNSQLDNYFYSYDDTDGYYNAYNHRENHHHPEARNHADELLHLNRMDITHEHDNRAPLLDNIHD
jgi:hypothetical protein